MMNIKKILIKEIIEDISFYMNDRMKGIFHSLMRGFEIKDTFMQHVLVRSRSKASIDVQILYEKEVDKLKKDGFIEPTDKPQPNTAVGRTWKISAKGKYFYKEYLED